MKAHITSALSLKKPDLIIGTTAMKGKCLRLQKRAGEQQLEKPNTVLRNGLAHSKIYNS